MAASRTTRRAARVTSLVIGVTATGCTSVDPGPNFSVADVTFDRDYFYCHIEPELIVAKKCGPGDGSDSNSCHFTSSVSGMHLVDHPPVDCGGGDHPVTLAQIGAGGLAQTNFVSVSGEMTRDYSMAPVYVRPSGSYHPRRIFLPDDPEIVRLLVTWASK